jgi:mono/diheme cytochrome c family protein
VTDPRCPPSGELATVLAWWAATPAHLRGGDARAGTARRRVRRRRRRASCSVPWVGLAWVTIAASSGVGCTEAARFHTPLVLGGVTVSPELLESGRLAYTHYCRACHGDRGDGLGPASYGLRPPPRDFTQGKFKFASVESGALPTDDDLRRIVRRGLKGTAMLAWDVPSGELDAILAYLKTFSPRWIKGRAGRAVEISADPWTHDGAGAIARGRHLYHRTAQCSACHPHYASPEEQRTIAGGPDDLDLTRFREDMYGAVRKDSDYQRGAPPVAVSVLPPDFREDPLRAGDSLPDVYRAIAAGIGGTAMPAWASVPPYRDAVTGEHWDGGSDIWALAHYVRSLAAHGSAP